MSTITRAADEKVGRPKTEQHVPGEVGTWVFIFGDMTIFAILFVTYLYYRADDPKLFDASQKHLDQTYGAVNTLLLLLSSLLVATAVRAVRARKVQIVPWLIAGAFSCGLAFSGLKIAEWHEKVSHGLKPATNDFYMYYFVLTGLHWFHLIIGLFVLSFLFYLARKPEMSKRQFGFFEGGACFWHMVDLLWIVLFPLLYLVK
ncbi:MAG: cytochrome oxidase subunit [Solirubrobacterales bacterium]|nr:cytochrome oxidase subunit [Solirubrobacterales bacterium]